MKSERESVDVAEDGVPCTQVYTDRLPASYYAEQTPGVTGTTLLGTSHTSPYDIH